MNLLGNFELNAALSQSDDLLARSKVQMADCGSIWPECENRLAHHCLNSLCGELERARKAASKCDAVVLSWTTRNLLEMSIVAKYLAVGKENRRDFVEQAIGDFYYFMKTLREIEGPRGSTDAMLEELKQRTQSDYRNGGSVTSQKLAEKIGLTTDSRFKLLSKLSHPTPFFTIGGTSLAPEVDTSFTWDSYAGVLLKWSNSYASEILDSISQRPETGQPAEQSDVA